jgi:epoxyqueuosine reductase
MPDLANQIKRQILLAGFEAVGITSADPILKGGTDLESFVQQNFHGTMAWLSHTHKQRSVPTSFFEEAKSIIIAAYNYYQKKEMVQFPEGSGTISIYARGRDYHKVLRNKFKRVLNWLISVEPKTRGRIFVDSFPIMEKPLAMRAGLGWIAKNTTLIIKAKGSYFLLGGIITNLSLPPDKPITEDFCGECHKCQDACPTSAFSEPFRLDARRCISYLTIEHKGDIDQNLSKQMDNYIFGCDICQVVCPWNIKFASDTQEKDFQSRFKPADLLLTKLKNLSQNQYEKMFEGTPIRRLGYERFKRNVQVAKKHMIKRGSTV